MRLVSVDVGNTSTAVGLWSDGRVSCVSHHDGGFKPAAAAVRALAGRKHPAAIAFVNVVPSASAAWRALAKSLALPLVAVSHRMFTRASGNPVRLDYPHPETIGPDRLADAAAVVDRYGAPAVVCDFGTAFTAAAITADCRWRGGAIAPGFALMRDYLFERTARLPRMKMPGRCPRIGRSTAGAMRFGAIVGYRGMAREIVGALAKDLPSGTRVVATGGFAGTVLAGSGIDCVIDPDLTLHGCGLLAARELERKMR